MVGYPLKPYVPVLVKLGGGIEKLSEFKLNYLIMPKFTSDLDSR
jgi:hypothetical protein